MTKNDLRSSTAHGVSDCDWTFRLTNEGKPTGETHTMTSGNVGAAFARLAKERWIEENRARPQPSRITEDFAKLVHTEFFDWLKGPIELEHPQHSVAHKVVPADLPHEAHIMLVQHDWARLMDNAEISGPNNEESPHLPYPITIFEFAFKGGVRFIVVACENANQERTGKEFVKTKSGWMRIDVKDGVINIPRNYTDQGKSLKRATDIVWSNIRAICAMLEAEVVEATPTRMPYKPNVEKPSKAPPTGISHHIVSLANRRRVGRLHAPGEPGHHKRLHFRRGHWRHYETHKTWIKWTLVGNPDLGFVDKEYTL